MNRKHHFEVATLWTGNRGSGTLDYRAYNRNFTLKINGKSDILGSSESAFNGDKSLHNPEDLLLAAVSSCHMLWYLHLCSERGVIVLEYTDHASAVMQEEEDGSGRFTSILLAPEVVINSEENLALAEALHEEAGKMCFIANSIQVPIEYKAQITVSKD